MLVENFVLNRGITHIRHTATPAHRSFVLAEIPLAYPYRLRAENGRECYITGNHIPVQPQIVLIHIQNQAVAVAFVVSDTSLPDVCDAVLDFVIVTMVMTR